MAQVQPESKVILIVSSDTKKVSDLETIIRTNISEPVIYSAPDGALALQRLNNVIPQILILDKDIPKMTYAQIIGYVTVHSNLEQVSIIVLDSLPEQEKYIDEIVATRLQFVPFYVNEPDMVKALYRALDYSFFRKKMEFTLRFLTAGEQLIKEGSKADFVYFVKKGTLSAYKEMSGKVVELGKINVGEFVGEMSYINGEARSAHVKSIEPRELIEVPIGVFESILYKRPSWSKALMGTLAKRIKGANQFRQGLGGSDGSDGDL